MLFPFGEEYEKVDGNDFLGGRVINLKRPKNECTIIQKIVLYLIHFAKYWKYLSLFYKLGCGQNKVLTTCSKKKTQFALKGK